MTLHTMTEKLEKFNTFVAKEFYKNEARERSFTSSDEFLNHLRHHSQYPEFKVIIDQIKPQNKDDQYGVITLVSDTLNIELQLKKKNCYSGPKTQDYLSRVDLRINAAVKWVSENSDLYPRFEDKLRELERIRYYFKKEIENNCHIDHTLLKDDNYQDPIFVEHFNAQHVKATHHFAELLAILEDSLVFENKKPKQMQSILYRIESQLMSKKRTEQTTIHAMSYEDKDFIEICTSAPVDKDRTISSAKKDEVGIANWMKSSAKIYRVQQETNNHYQLSHETTVENYRSASIVPHDILLNKRLLTKLFGKGGLNKALAFETAKRNIEEHLIPELVAEKMKQAGTEGPDGVININYEMLTLISPISKHIDKLLDPDATQYLAIRQALNHYNGRLLNVSINGEDQQVQFSAIYHNYGVNPGRGFPMERAANMKAYNEVIDRSVDLLNKTNDPTLTWIIEDIPQFSVDQKQRLMRCQSDLEKLYQQMDNNPNKLTKEEHVELMNLNAKKNNHQPFSFEEEAQYKQLVAKFAAYTSDNKLLQIKADRLEREKRTIHGSLAKERRMFFVQNHEVFEKQISQLEKDDTVSPALREQVNHTRTLLEFTQLSELGYDSLVDRILKPKETEKNNRLNYEIQSSIQQLNHHCNWVLHETCKSGKDRTNVALEKFKAKVVASLSLGRFPKFDDQKSVLKNIRDVFERGFNQGPGNRLCAFNMLPGAQQISANDVPTDKANPAIFRQVSLLQKFKKIDKIKVKREQLAKIKEVVHATPLKNKRPANNQSIEVRKKLLIAELKVRIKEKAMDREKPVKQGNEPRDKLKKASKKGGNLKR